MADAFQIDDDWKKQAQDEKRRLAEEQQKRQAAAAAPAAPLAAPGAPPTAATPTAPGNRVRGRRDMPQASFSTLVQSVMTQSLYYLGDLSPGGGTEGVNLDMAKHHLDTLTVLEEKSANNLDETERKFLDAALYESRTRFISVASQYI